MTTPRVRTPDSTSKVESLPHELQELLLEIALAVHKRGIYPPSHPMLRGAVEGLARSFVDALSHRTQLQIGVSNDRLVIDGVATDGANPLLSDLALRLHEHELGGVTFLRGVTHRSLEAFVGALSVSASRGGEPIGRHRAALLRWPDIVLAPLAFERLELFGDADHASESPSALGTRATDLWNQLANVAFDGDESNRSSFDNPAELDSYLQRRVSDGSNDRQILGFLRELINEIGEGGVQDAQLKHRVSQLIESLDEQSLEKLLHMGGDVAARGELLAKANASLAAMAVVRMTKAAAAQGGETIASSMLRLLTKLAKDAESRRPTQRNSDRALRRVIHRLLSDWKLIDPNPEAYTVVLSDIATATSNAHADLGRDGCEPDRILQIGVATESRGPSVELALARTVTAHGVASTVDFLLSLEGTALRDELVDRLINESTFREQLALAQPDIPMLQHAVDRLRLRAVRPLAAGLERRDESDADWIVDLLARVGPDVVPEIASLVAHVSPRALRHIIVLCDRVDAWPEGLEPQRIVRHPDVTVRREMIRFMLKRESLRESAILAGLRDPDLRVFNLALGAASAGCSVAVLRLAMQRLDDSSLGDELRARGVRVVGESRSDEVRSWLIRRATTQRWVLRTLRLRKPSIELFAAINALATHHADSADAQRVLFLARTSRHADIRRAAISRTAATSLP